MHHSEFEKAVDDLHRYFDYAIQSASALVQPGGMLLVLTEANTYPAKQPNFMAYAALNLAGLHFRFGNMEEGIFIIYETVCPFNSVSDV